MTKPQTLIRGSKNLGTENWVINDPNGEPMCCVSGKKANWYLDNDLAVKSGEKEIKLTFEPKGNGFGRDEKEFGLSPRIIQCVITGIEDDLQRHHIVPSCYRKHFPEQFKSKNHHDVVLVHYKKHEDYEQHAFDFKNELAREYGVPTLAECNYQYSSLLSEYGGTRIKMLSRLYALFRNPNMSKEKIIENLTMVANYTDIPVDKMLKFNYMQLLKLYHYLKSKHDSEFEYFKKLTKRDYDHGYMVVSKLETDEDLEFFIKRWRKHFIYTMNPQYMPKGWSIDFRCKIEL